MVLNLKIDTSIKRRNLPDHFLEHLSFTDIDQIKFGVFGTTFIMIDLLMILPLLYPTHTFTAWITIPLIALINVWAMSMLVRKANTLQFEFIIFTGCSGAVASFCYFVFVQKMAYIGMDIKTPAFFIISLFFYISFLLFQLWFHLKKYSSLSSKFAKFKDLPWHYKILSIAAPSGYIAAHYLFNNSISAMNSMLLIIYSMFSIFFTYVSVKFFHRYFFMKANQNFLNLSKGLKNHTHKKIN